MGGIENVNLLHLLYEDSPSQTEELHKVRACARRIGGWGNQNFD